MTDIEAIQLAGYMYLHHRYDGAEKVLLEQIKQSPDNAIVYYNLALLMSIRGEFDRCFEYAEKSMRLGPWSLETADLLAHQLLRAGRWQEGLEFFESRFGKFQGIPYLQIPCPVWDGTPRFGRKILVWCEQGLGDTTQFSRFLPVLKEQGYHVSVLVQDELVDLFNESGLANEVYPLRNVVTAKPDANQNSALMINEQFFAEMQFNAHISIMSLARVLKVTPEFIPGNSVFLKPSAHRVEWAKGEIARLGGSGKKLGLVWAGSSSRHPEFEMTSRRRRAPLETLAPLFKVPGFTFYNFQKGQDSVAALEFPAILSPRLSDSYSDTAALLLQMDALITIDTSIAHVASSIGVPVWLMNRYDTCWRWLRGRSDSPWYPKMKLFRQNKPGDWASVVEQIRHEMI